MHKANKIYVLGSIVAVIVIAAGAWALFGGSSNHKVTYTVSAPATTGQQVGYINEFGSVTNVVTHTQKWTVTVNFDKPMDLLLQVANSPYDAHEIVCEIFVDDKMVSKSNTVGQGGSTVCEAQI